MLFGRRSFGEKLLIGGGRILERMKERLLRLNEHQPHGVLALFGSLFSRSVALS